MPCIRALLIGNVSQQYLDTIQCSDLPDYCEKKFSFLVRQDDALIARDLADFRPHAIITEQDFSRLDNLMAQPLSVRQFWVNSLGQNGRKVASDIIANFTASMDLKKFPDQPLVSIFTPAHKTGKIILRTYASLKKQSYGNWEWVVYDDSDDDETAAILKKIADEDHRVRIYCGHRHSGSIGEVKRMCAGLCLGLILVELDHDDELTIDCLISIVKAFQSNPEVGFAYSHCAEIRDGMPAGKYPDGWGFGYGSYRDESVDGKTMLVTVAPEINAKTIRYITACPNHVRAWTTQAYWAAGGHNARIDIGDDYELILRTFLSTRMIRIDRCLYIQHYHGENSQDSRRPEIQRIVTLCAGYYEMAIHERFEQLGINDFIWTERGLDWSRTESAEKAVEARSGLVVITACTRPDNIERIHKSLGDVPLHWIIVEDCGSLNGRHVVIPKDSIHKITVIQDETTPRLPWHGEVVKNSGIDFAVNKSSEEWVYVLDDDNEMFPDFYKIISPVMKSTNADIIAFDQILKNGDTRNLIIKVGEIDQAQYVIRATAIGSARIPLNYKGDGMFIESLSKTRKIQSFPGAICYYNRLSI